MKRRLSTLLSYSTNALPSLAEIHKQELETEITNVEKVLDQEYTSIPRSISRENHSHFVEEKGLKANLNRLVSENKGKEAKIAGLIDLINCYSFMSRKAGPVSTQNFHSDYEIDDLREQLFNEAENIKEEENYTEVLIETKRKIIESTLCWKEKLGALSKVQGEIDRKYSEVLYSKQKAAFNLHAVQSEIAHLKKFQQKSQKKFRNAVEKGKMVKETHTNEVREKIEKISRNNLKSRVILT